MHIKKAVIYSILAVATFLALVFVAFPPLIKQLAIKEIDKATGRKSRIEKVSLNPFTLSAGITGLRLSEKGSDITFVSFSSARLSLSPLSLPKRSVIISEVQLASPHLHIVRNAPNNFNFTDLLGGDKPKKKEGTLLFSVNNITLTNGSIDFEDRAVASGKFHRLREMRISVPFISNMPYLADRYVQPHFSAVVNGAPLRFDGQLKPLTRAVEATVALKANQVDLPFYLGYVPFPLPVQVKSGRLSSALEVGYRLDDKTGPELRLAGTVSLERVAALEPDNAPLVVLDRLQLNMRNALLLSRHFDINSLEVAGMELFSSRDRFGVWNFQKLGSDAEPRKAKPEAEVASEVAADEKKALNLKLASFSFKDGVLHFTDAVPKGGFKTDLRDINLSLQNLSLDPGHKAPFQLKLGSSKGETIEVKGDLAARPLDVRANLTLDGLPLKEYYPYLADTLTAPVSGTLGVTSELTFNGTQGLVLEKSTLKVAELAAPFGEGEGLRLKEVLLSGIAADLKRRKAVVESVQLKSGNMVLSQEKDGRSSVQRLLTPKKPSAKEPAIKEVRSNKPFDTKAAPPPFSYRIGKITGSDLGIKFTDRSREEEPVFSLKQMNFTLANIAGPKQEAIPFTLASRYGNNGRISAAGNITAQPLKLKGKVTLQRIPLRDFDAYLPYRDSIFIADGALNTSMALDLEKSGTGFKGAFGGSVGVNSFYCQDTELEEDLLKWESLQVDQVTGTLAPLTIAIKDVVLTNFYSRIIVRKDGTLNVQHLMDEEKQTQTGVHVQGAVAPGAPPAKPATAGVLVSSPAKPAPAQDPAAAPSQSAVTATVNMATSTPAPAADGQAANAEVRPISVEAITLQGGTLAFSDRHLQTPFDATFYNLGGRVSGLSSQYTRMADVDLRGNLENHSPLSITGTVNPLRGDLYLDMKLRFKDIELSSFTPYSGTYLGYNVDQGKLFLDLLYHIENKSLTSENRVFIDQFTFGKSVESEKATKLPVRLAVALLKDRKGEIHLDLPVTGRTDSPEFSVWRVVLQMLQNLLVKAATSPFALLGSMIGGDADFSAVYFAPGSDELMPAEQQKLTQLAKVLQDRPALNMEISGFVDRNRDADGYRNELLLKKMKGEKFRALVKQGQSPAGQTLETMQILPDEYHTHLKAVYQKEKFSKPRNALGLVKELPDEEMKKLILAHTLVGDNELQALARERAKAVKAFLQKGEISPERLFEKSADIYKPASKEGVSASRVEFGANVK